MSSLETPRIDAQHVVEVLMELARHFEEDPPPVLSRNSVLFRLLRDALPDWVPQRYGPLQAIESCPLQCEWFDLGLCQCAKFPRQRYERQIQDDDPSQTVV
jgi:hypothetical protein